MTEQLNEYETRLARLQTLKAAGVIPYANRYDKQQDILKLVEIGKRGEISDGDVLLKEWATQQYSTAGRMMLFRTMGKLSFATLRDATGDIQIAFVKWLCKLNTWREVVESISIDSQDVSAYKFVEKYLDVADFIGVKGELFVTKHGELTLFVDEFQLLSKALRPLGNKWSGITDEEKLYRQRYLDMTMNEESYQRFLLRSKFTKIIREFYRENDFIELETPILWNAASGAAAKPFMTHHHDYDLDVYLRIAPEIALKMATWWRFERVFEVSRNFRNEGSDPSHVQEFTSVEHYAAWRNFEDNMNFTEKMFDYIFKNLGMDTVRNVKDKEWNIKQVDFKTPWPRLDYVEQIKKDSGIDVSMYTAEDEEKIREDIKKAWHEREWLDIQTTATMIDYLYKKVTRPNILWPAFIYNYPKAMQPLARQNDTNPNIVEQFQVVVNGREIIKAYSELVDPVIQQENFDEQAHAVAKWDNEATSEDTDFILAMEHGIPCQSGRAVGIDRFITLITEQDNLRDVVMFPLMKPRDNKVISLCEQKQKDKDRCSFGQCWCMTRDMARDDTRLLISMLHSELEQVKKPIFSRWDCYTRQYNTSNSISSMQLWSNKLHLLMYL